MHKFSDKSLEQLKEIQLGVDGITFTGHPDDAPVNSSYHQLTEFMGSAIWKDFINMVDERIELTATELMNASNFDETLIAQTEIKTLSFVREIPARLLIEMETAAADRVTHNELEEYDV